MYHFSKRFCFIVCRISNQRINTRERTMVVSEGEKKKKTVVKKKGEVTKKTETSGIKKESQNAMADAAMETPYKIDRLIDQWVLPNRAKFTTWLDTAFAPRKMKKVGKREKEMGVDMFPHQSFIKDYLQYQSPYRGLLLYHGLGTGKSCSSIAAAEMLYNHMDVIIMIPASLRDNYVNEIKKCGRDLFQMQQNWVFIPKEDVSEYVYQTLKVKELPTFVKSKKGLWLPDPEKTPVSKPFAKLTGDEQQAIQAQMDFIARKRFQYINFNGMTRKHIEELTKGGQNPFDNKCIIIDEVHNLVSRISNNRIIGGAIYKLLLNAKGAKIICLSGTPIINYPHEIAYLINIVTGKREVYEIKTKGDTLFTQDAIEKMIAKDHFIDTYTVAPNGHKVYLSLLPYGFHYTSRDDTLVQRIPEDAGADVKYPKDAKKYIRELFSSEGLKIHNTIVVKESLALPTKEEEFVKYFVNFATNHMENSHLFMRRIMGSISFYSTYNPDLYPSVETHEVALPMNDSMFTIYEKKRLQERRQENKRKGGKGGNVFHSSGQVYRFYSRALCNFVFPSKIKRPFPSNMKYMKKEIDIMDEEENLMKEEGVGEEETKKPTKKSDMAKEYIQQIDDALQALYESDVLELKNLGKYSPKMKTIVQHLSELRGCGMVYSQFRKVEGLGILALALQKRGFVPFKIKRTEHGSWDIDMPEEDWGKPKYVIFTGSDEETRILLKIFNSEMDAIPAPIREKLPLIAKASGAAIPEKEPLNTRGDIIRVMMITQSGAEGISLKNVRQVHIMEPYWNSIRTDQVVGRAVRTRSHIDLPPKERHVDVYMYHMTFTEKQKETSVTIKRQDKSMTSDEYIYNIAKTKATIIDEFLDAMKTASVDCAMNAPTGTTCLRLPNNISTKEIIVKEDINDELLNSQYKKKLLMTQWKATVYITKKGEFMVRTDTNEVYDYRIYIETGRLVKLGIMNIASDSTGKHATYTIMTNG